MKTQTSMLSARAITILLLLTAMIATGCGPTIGWMVNAFAPPKKIEAVYEPPEGKTILVFVDDMKNPVSYEPVKAQLTESLNAMLEENKVAAATVPYRKLLELMSASRDFNRMAVGEVGQKLGADMVLYVIVEEFSLKENEMTPLWQGKLATTVRIVDTAEGRLWPDDRPEGYPVRPVETSPRADSSPRYGEVLSKVLAAKMADRIAKLLYDHKIPAFEARKQEQTEETGLNYSAD